MGIYKRNIETEILERKILNFMRENRYQGDTIEIENTEIEKGYYFTKSFKIISLCNCKYFIIREEGTTEKPLYHSSDIFSDGCIINRLNVNDKNDFLKLAFMEMLVEKNIELEDIKLKCDAFDMGTIIESTKEEIVQIKGFIELLSVAEKNGFVKSIEDIDKLYKTVTDSTNTKKSYDLYYKGSKVGEM